VTSLQAHADDLQASHDVSTATVQSLEATLAAIERAEARRSAAAGGGSSSSSTRAIAQQAQRARAAAGAGADSNKGGTAAAGGGAAGGVGSAASRRTSRSSSISNIHSQQASPRDALAPLSAVSQQQQLAAGTEGGLCGDDEWCEGVGAGPAAAAGGSSSSSSASAAALSKELVKAHTAAADAQRKLRVSAR